MKKIIAIALTVFLIAGSVFALSACSKSQENGGKDETTTEATTEPENKTVKISSSEIYVTFNTADYNYDEELTKIVSRDGTAYIYAKGLDDSNLSARRDSFDGLQNNDKLAHVFYKDMPVGDNTAKTAVYTDGKGFYKRYFIEFANPTGSLKGVEIQAALGTDKTPEIDFDDMVKSLEVK